MAGELDAELWSGLPTELMELVLQRLPISSLCKFRAVCKHWSTLPTVTAEDPYFLCFPFNSISCELYSFISCKLYSFTRNQWEDLDLSFLAPLLAQHCPGETISGHVIRLDNSCSDGGLLCLKGAICDDLGYEQTRFLLVCNPLTRTTKFLPSLDPDTTEDLMYLVHFGRSADYLMHRDPESGAYKIFAVVVEFHVQLHFYMYDSNLGLWEQILTLKRDDVGKNLRSCSIVFNGVYYNCACGGGKRAYELSAYNMKEGRWVVAGVQIPELDSSITSVSFLVRNDCLLLLAKTRWNRTRVYRIHDDSELGWKLSRRDGAKEINLPKELDWHQAFAYRDFILFHKEVHRNYMVVDIADRKKAVKTRIVPFFGLFRTGSGPLWPIYTRATFSLQATL
ncbi:hypothetical protein KC19_3G169700 [Ceratodon purpureus]|uniref:F-box domain-containing protein n=1 Tax=Ceratodon purpureus TaxID=3225 RepID=A0A8T0IM51_CERPU|nr:hypothetical protein KC19_3G169700 [Ceratodon purpureus]